MGYTPIAVQDRTAEYDVLEDGDTASVQGLNGHGLTEHTATVMNGGGLFYILVEVKGEPKWFPIRYD